MLPSRNSNSTQLTRGGTGNKVLPPPPSGRKSAAAANGAGGQARRKKKRTESFALYIYKVLKSVHSDTGIGRSSMSIMNSFINDIFDRLCVEATRLLVISRKKTLTRHEMLSAAKLLIPGELFKHALDEAVQAVAKFEAARDHLKTQRGRSLPLL